MALYHKWDVKNGFAYVLQFFSLISDSVGGVYHINVLLGRLSKIIKKQKYVYVFVISPKIWTIRLYFYPPGK